MARVQLNDPDPSAATVGSSEPPQPAREDVVETPGRDVSTPPGSALFRALLAAGMDAGATYTVVREMESMAGQNVVAQLTAQIQLAVGEVRNDLAGVKSDLAAVKSDLAAVKSDLAGVRSDLSQVQTDLTGVKTDVAVLKREVRLIWLLLIPTVTAVLVRLFTA